MRKVYCNDCYFYRGSYMRECRYNTKVEHTFYQKHEKTTVDEGVQNKGNDCDWFKEKPPTLYRWLRSLITFSDDLWEENGF